MKDLIERNYQSIVKRGFINPYTEDFHFVMKLEEEVQEFIEAVNYNLPNETEEACDIILVCLNWARHYNLDIEKELLNKIKINENRND